MGKDDLASAREYAAHHKVLWINELANDIERLYRTWHNSELALRGNHDRALDKIGSLEEANRALQERLEKLTALIDERPRHGEACNTPITGGECTCGWDAILDTAPTSVPEKRGQTGTGDVQVPAQATEITGDPGGIRTHDPVLRRHGSPETEEGEKP